MHISVRKYQMDPARVDELMRKVNTEFVPLVSDSPGFVAYYAIDAGEGVVASISVFETQAEAEESNRKAAGWVKGVAELLPNPPQITSGAARVTAGVRQAVR